MRPTVGIAAVGIERLCHQIHAGDRGPIAHRDLDLGRRLLHVDPHDPALGRGRERVGDQAVDRLPDANGVAGHEPRPGIGDDLQADALRRGGWPLSLRGLLHERAQIDRPQVELERARGDPRQVEQFVDECGLHGHAALDRFQSRACLVGIERSRPQQLSPDEDRRQWVAELVHDHRERFILQAIGFDHTGGHGKISDALLELGGTRHTRLPSATPYRASARQQSDEADDRGYDADGDDPGRAAEARGNEEAGDRQPSADRQQ